MSAGRPPVDEHEPPDPHLEPLDPPSTVDRSPPQPGFLQAIDPEPPPPPPRFNPEPLPPTADEAAPDFTPALIRWGGWGTIGIGILIFFTGNLVPAGIFILTGILILTMLGRPERLNREQIVDRWDTLIEDGRGQGDAILTTLSTLLEAQQLPNLSHTRTALAAARFSSATRPFLVVRQHGNARLRPYRMHVCARDYGGSLQTSWYLTYHRSFFERLLPNPLVKLNLFDEQDLRAAATSVHHTLITIVIDLMLQLGQDTSRIERRTQGFLGIS